MFHVAHAQAALQLGLCKVAVIAYGSTQRTIGRRQASVREYNPYETPFRPFLPSTAYALAASRHMHQYGTTREQLAAVAVAARRMGVAEPGRVGKEAADDRRGIVGADDQLPVHGARHLPRDRWRRRGDHDHRRARPLAEKAAGLCARLRPGDHPRQYFEHAGSDRDRGVAVGPRRLRDGAARRRPTSMSSSSTTRSRSTRSSSSRISASAQRAKAGALSQSGRIAPGRQPAGQHQWRRPLLLPPRHVRPVPADRGDAPAARRMRRAPGRRLRDRDRPRQWRRAVVAEHGHPRHAATFDCKGRRQEVPA